MKRGDLESPPPRTSPKAALESRLFDMPYSAAEPRMINTELGLDKLVARAGHNAGYTIDVTLLDAPDHRLIRSGVLLAHRVLAGRGEWFLGAPDWSPLLPAEQTEQMGQADLPAHFADLIGPFRRRATLGPIAALTCERREFALRGPRPGTVAAEDSVAPDGSAGPDSAGAATDAAIGGRTGGESITVALLRDDRVTVRRGGLTTARFREVMLTPVGPGLTSEQSDWLAQALVSCGSTEVTEFPQLAGRLGAPATGLTDFPLPVPLDPDAPFKTFVSALLMMRLREIVAADLAVRADQPGAAALLAARTTQLNRELAGMSSVLDPRWTEDLDEELDWIAGEAQVEHLRVSEPAEDEPRASLAGRLRGERYLTLLERLVTASRAPQLGDSSQIPTSEVVTALLETRIKRLRKIAGRLKADDSLESWEAAEVAAADFYRVCDIAALVPTKATRKLPGRVKQAAQLLVEANRHGRAAQVTKNIAEGAPAAEAFEAGRTYEHERMRAKDARDGFVSLWPRVNKKLDLGEGLDL